MIVRYAMEFRLYFEIHERGLKSVFKSEYIVLDFDNYCDNNVKQSMIFTPYVNIIFLKRLSKLS